MPNGRTREDIVRSLTNQPPINDIVIEVFEAVRHHAKRYGTDIIELVPEGREKSLALTKLEESVMWAIKGIALNQSAVDTMDWDIGKSNG